MLLKFIGVGDAANYKLGNTSAYIEYGQRKEKLLLIDCGGTVFHQLLKLNLLVNKQQVTIILTYLHPDHIGSLGDLIFHLNIFFGIIPKIIFQDPSAVHKMLQCQYVMPHNSKYEIDTACQADLGPEIQISSYHTDHVGVDAYCYIVHYRENNIHKNVFYSGGGKLKLDLLKDFESHLIDEWYQDTYSLNIPTVTHALYKDLLNHTYLSDRDRIYCIHRDIHFNDEKARKDGFNVPYPEAPYLMQTSLVEDVKNYRDTKSISLQLVQMAQIAEVLLKQPIYRGDCVYPSFLHEGAHFRFHNHVSSWSYDKDIATRFANTQAAPDWYFDEDEWCGEYPYPFKTACEEMEELVPVLFKFEGNKIHGLVTDEFIDVANDKEYVTIDEKEVIVGDTEFVIKHIEQIPNSNILLVTLTPAEENMVLSF